MITKEFLLTGDATFVIGEPRGGLVARLTYRVTKVEANGRWPTAYFVRFLASKRKSNEITEEYLGRLNTHTAQVEPTSRSTRDAESRCVKLLNRVLPRVWADDHEAYERFGY